MSPLETLLGSGLLLCPVCGGAEPFALEVLAEEAGAPLHGLLACPACPARYPLVDGVTILSGDVLGDLRREAHPLWARRDLPPALASYLRLAESEEGDPAWRRQMLAIYGRDLPGEQAPGSDGPLADALRSAGAATREALATRLRALAAASPPESWALDLGCGLGWSTLALAQERPVVALDRDLGVLQVVGRLARTGRAEVPVWRYGGRDYLTRTLACPPPPQGVVPILSDALAPPLAPGVWHAAGALHLLDNVPDPLGLLRTLTRLLVPGGGVLLSSPYEWSPRATPPEARLGEVIQAPGSQDPAEALRTLLAVPQAGVELRCEEELELPWVLQRHQRSVHVHWCHALVAQRR